MKNLTYTFLNNSIGWLLFIFASTVYLLTAESTASFWDCGEFIATSYKLQVCHPPGAPTFQLISRIFTMFAFGDVEKVAFMANTLSALSSGLTITFLFWTITLLVKKFVLKNNNKQEASLNQKLSIFGAAFVGALTYTFTDSFWFSAVESEAYSLSSLFTAVTFWAVLKWEEQADSPHSMRWMILIAYLIGLSIGVHLLNLITLPAIVFIYYFKKYKVTRKGIIAVAALSIVLLGAILYVIIPGIVSLAGRFELFFVNNIRLPFNSGTLIYFILLIGGIVFGIHYSYKKNLPVLNLSLKALTFLLIGYSTYFMLIIRSDAETPVNQNNPSNAVSLLSYLQREQYGSVPLFYGQYYNSPLNPSNEWKDMSPVYKKDENTGKYVVINKREKTVPTYDSDFCTIFPRMHSSESHHVKAYQQWANIKGAPVRHKRTGEVTNKPTFAENLRFFFAYQVSYMYIRYFMWNFAGRQNDIQGHGDLFDGNWISGIPFIDSRLGPQNDLPESLTWHKSRTKYYLLPLLIGLLGLYYHITKSKKGAFIVGLLFIMTGLAIVLYVNQTPYQPRERDYAYAASFYAFAIWIGMGVLGVHHYLKQIIKNFNASIIISIFLCILLVPVILAKENWNNHDRSNRYTARDIAKNYLDSCEPNAILFTNGDNDTFPLWYIQEVEEYRTDVRVVNLSLLNTDWYINQMKRKAYDGEPVPFTLEEHQYQSGSLEVVYLIEQGSGTEYVNLKDLFDVLQKQPERLKFYSRGYPEPINYFPTKKFRLPVDSAKVVDMGIVKPEDAHLIVDEIRWEINKQAIHKSGLMLLNLIAYNNWERPIYFAITTGDDVYYGLQDYFQLDGLAYKLVPIKTKSQQGLMGRIDTDVLYDKLMNTFVWGNMDIPGIYLDETNRRMTMNFRNNFARLANALINENKVDSAIAVLNKAMYLMPEENIPYDNYFIVPLAEAYYKAGVLEKGDQIMQRVLDIHDDNLKYYFSFTGIKARKIDDNKQQSLAIVQRTLQIVNQYQRKDLMEYSDNIFKTYYQMYSSGM